MVIGREREFEQLKKFAETESVIALVGPSGVGKTAIARAYAETNGNGRFVDCYGLGAGELSGRLSDAEELGDPGDTAAVLVLDNWQPEIGVPDFDGRVLLTSHAPPAGIVAIAVSPFEIPESGDVQETAAFALFQHEAQRALPGATFRPDEVARLLRTLGGLPLGIVIAARHAAAFGADEINRLILDGVEIEDDQHEGRHRSFRRALEFSWRQLSEPQRRCLYVVARFRRPIRLPSIAKVADLPLADVMNLIRDMVKRAIVTPGAYPRPLELWKRVGVEQFRADAPDAAAAIDQRIFDIAAELAPEQYLPDPSEIGDGPSFWESAVAVAVDEQDRESGIRILSALYNWSLSFARERFAGSGYLRDVALALNSSRVHLLRAKFYQSTGDEAQIENALNLAWEAAETPEDKSLVELERGVRASTMGDVGKALQHVSAAREYHDSSRARVFAACYLVFQGDPLAAQEIVELVRNDDSASGRVKTVIGWAAIWTARTSERVAVAREYLSAARALGDTPIEISMLRSLADALSAEGRFDECLKMLDEALAAAERVSWSQMLDTLRAERLLARLGTADSPALSDFDGWDTRELSPDIRAKLAAALVVLASAEGDLSVAHRWARHLDDKHFTLPPLHDSVRLARHVYAIATDDEPPKPDNKRLDVLTQLHAAGSLDESDQFALFDDVAAVVADHSYAGRLAASWAEVHLTPFMRRLRWGASIDADVVVLNDYRTLRADGEWHRIPETTALLLGALIRQDTCDFEELGEAAWPGEIVPWESLRNRVSVRVSALRKLGLKPYLLKTEEGFVLDVPKLVVEPS